MVPAPSETTAPALPVLLSHVLFSHAKILTTLCSVWAQCYELIAAGLFPEALKKWETMIGKDGPKADTENFHAQIKAGIKADEKKGQASK